MNNLVTSRRNWLKKQIQFSYDTFGQGARTEGVARHILSEIEELKENPRDIFEWVDVMILAVDGLWRQTWFTDWNYNDGTVHPLEDDELVDQVLFDLFGSNNSNITLLDFFNDEYNDSDEDHEFALESIEFLANSLINYGSTLNRVRWGGIFLEAADGAQAVGYLQEELVYAYLAKLAKNRERAWPDVADADETQPIFHKKPDIVEKDPEFQKIDPSLLTELFPKGS